ncbi:MAG: hypothetical protein ACP6IQ_01910 [Candidatus Njordarchaeia archaeon]
MSKGIILSGKHGVGPALIQCYMCGNDTGALALLSRHIDKLEDKYGNPPKYIINGSLCNDCKKMEKDYIKLLVVPHGSPKSSNFSEILGMLVKTGWIPKDKLEKTFPKLSKEEIEHILETGLVIVEDNKNGS